MDTEDYAESTDCAILLLQKQDLFLFAIEISFHMSEIGLKAQNNLAQSDRAGYKINSKIQKL